MCPKRAIAGHTRHVFTNFRAPTIAIKLDKQIPSSGGTPITGGLECVPLLGLGCIHSLVDPLECVQHVFVCTVISTLICDALVKYG